MSETEAVSSVSTEEMREESVAPNSQTSWQLESGAIRVVEGTEAKQDMIREAWEAEKFEAVPVMVTLENRSPEEIHLSHGWNGIRLALEIEETEPPALSLSEAVAAWHRHTGTARVAVAYAILSIGLLAVSALFYMAVLA